MLLTKKLTAKGFLNNRRLFLKPLWLVKCMHFEYWPMWLLYLPLLPFLIEIIIKCRSVHFYKYVNPSIKNGGLIGESKKLIMDAILPAYKPKTLLFYRHQSVTAIWNALEKDKFQFPLIVKPDIGEQGRGVEKICDLKSLSDYCEKSNEDLIIQEFIDFPVELAIFFYKLPGINSGKVTSVTKKEFLSVTGNGQESIAKLILSSERARFQLKRLEQKWNEKINLVPGCGEKIILEVVGNHCKGTKFLDGSELINDRLHGIFNTISSSVNGFYYGRYDLKVSSLDDLYNGNNIRILELNGAGAIPAHIFDPDYSLFQAWKDIVFHWRIAGEIARINKRNKVKFVDQVIVDRVVHG